MDPQLSSENGIAHVLNSSLTKTEIASQRILPGLTYCMYMPELAEEENVNFLNCQNFFFCY
jgi:ATP-dependent DNA helicase RecQ